MSNILTKEMLLKLNDAELFNEIQQHGYKIIMEHGLNLGEQENEFMYNIDYDMMYFAINGFHKCFNYMFKTYHLAKEDYLLSLKSKDVLKELEDSFQEYCKTNDCKNLSFTQVKTKIIACLKSKKF